MDTISIEGLKIASRSMLARDKDLVEKGGPFGGQSRHRGGSLPSVCGVLYSRPPFDCKIQKISSHLFRVCLLKYYKDTLNVASTSLQRVTRSDF